MNALYQKIDQSRKQYKKFINKCQMGHSQYNFTLNSNPSCFALCFAIFGLNLISENSFLHNHSHVFSETIKSNLLNYKMQRQNYDLTIDKPFLQLLTFSLSCLSILNTLHNNPLEEIVIPLIPNNIENYLNKINALIGMPQSGNLSMFVAILLIHAQQYLGINTQNQIDDWIRLHLSKMNNNGFWGNNNKWPYLQFQNGYHQYEILNFLNVKNKNLTNAAKHILELIDNEGHFAPYPGGGSCYDYDAIYILTHPELPKNDSLKKILEKTFNSLLSEQNVDGGFAESQHIHPLSLKNINRYCHHMCLANKIGRYERIKRCLCLLLNKNKKIHTHWSNESRLWNESNLWDSWFRMQTIALIQLTFHSELNFQWKFIKFPGIGYRT